MDKKVETIYPILSPSAPPSDGSQEYRLSTIRQIRTDLENARQDHRKTKHKYNRAINVLCAIELSSTSAGGIISIIGASGIISAPIIAFWFFSIRAKNFIVFYNLQL